VPSAAGTNLSRGGTTRHLAWCPCSVEFCWSCCCREGPDSNRYVPCKFCMKNNCTTNELAQLPIRAFRVGLTWGPYQMDLMGIACGGAARPALSYPACFSCANALHRSILLLLPLPCPDKTAREHRKIQDPSSKGLDPHRYHR
jgi:hypothetical protein